MTSFQDFSIWYENVGRAGQTYDEAYRLCSLVESTNSTKGVIIEVGVDQGGTARIFSKYAPHNKKIFLFDTFEGLVFCNSENDGEFIKDGYFKSDFEQICKKFEGDPRILVTKGVFPQSGQNILDSEQISLAHLDVDTYQSTLDSLHFIYDKIVVGGTIIIHDYINNPHTPGVKLAVDDFFMDKSDILFLPEDNGAPNTQIIVTKK